MKKELFILAVLGIVGQIISLIGIFFYSESNDALMINMWSFLGFGSLSAVVLLVDKKQTENKMKEEFKDIEELEEN
jgi:hypothetical protein